MTLKAFSASEDEMSLANQILLFSNCQESGALKSDAAIDIFKRSGLSNTILRDIWNMADENASGNLTIHELAAAIRLMGWVQVGESLDESLLSQCALVAPVSSKTAHSCSCQPVLFRPSTESQMWLENVMLALQILDFHHSITMICAILNELSVQGVLLVVFWMVRPSSSLPRDVPVTSSRRHCVGDLHDIKSFLW